jgi:very-short-patch-repair endonuclease
MARMQPTRARRLRANMNATELLVWSRIRGRQLDGWKFRRQHPIGPYVVDFYCPAARLIVEIDGPAHGFDEQWAYDVRRQAWLESEQYQVLRVTVENISRSLDDALATIYYALLERENSGCLRRPHPPASPGTSPQAGKSYSSPRSGEVAAKPPEGHDLLPRPHPPALPGTSPQAGKS